MVENEKSAKKTDNDVEENFPEDFYPYDKENVIQVYKNIKSKIKEGYKLGELLQLSFQNNAPIDEVVFAGMGGSAIAGIVMKNYLTSIDSKIRVLIANDYELPHNVSKNAVVICNSYSGNTEETLSMFKDAQRKKLRLVVICSGGKLKELADNYKIPKIMIPTGLHPRQAFPYSFFPLLKILEKLKIIDDHSKYVESLIDVLRKQHFETLAISLANKLFNKKIIIYSSKLFAGVIYRWKTQFNENSKVPAHIHIFPELCHNELCQYTHPNEDFHVIILKNDKDIRRLSKRIDITKKLLSKSCEVTEIDVTGHNEFTKLYTSILIGDLTSYYLALKYKRDPSEDSIIGVLKKELGPFIS